MLSNQSELYPCIKHGFKKGQCQHCKLCLGCQSDCEQDYHQGYSNSKENKERRERIALNILARELDDKDVSPSIASALPNRKRPSTLKEEDLEDAEAKKLHEELEALDAKRINNSSIAEVAKLLDVKLSERIMERVSAFRRVDLNNVRRLSEMVAGLGKLVESICIRVCGYCVDVGTELLDHLYKAKNPPPPQYSNGTKHLAEYFLKAQNKVNRRMLFALLLESISRDDLLTELRSAKLKVLADSDFVQNWERQREQKASRRIAFLARKADAAARKAAIRQMSSPTGLDEDENLESVDDDENSGDEDSEDSASEVSETTLLTPSHNNSNASSASATSAPQRPRRELTLEERLDSLCIWPTRRTRCSHANQDLQNLKLGKALTKHASHSRISLESITSTFRWIETFCSLGWAGGGTQSIKIGDTAMQNVPFLQVSVGMSHAWEQYRKDAELNEKKVYGSKRVGRHAFFTVYKSITRQITQKTALSYLFTDACEASDLLRECVDQVEKFRKMHLQNRDPTTLDSTVLVEYDADDLSQLITAHSTHFKYKIKREVCVEIDCGGDSFHCGAVAVAAKCKFAQKHEPKCEACKLNVALPSIFKEWANHVANDIARVAEAAVEPQVALNIRDEVDEIKSMLRVVKFFSRTFYLFQQHVVRAAWQAEQIAKMFASLQPDEIAIIVDHKQKVNPYSFRESSSDHFGKAGMSVMGAAVRYRLHPNQPLQVRYYDIIFNDTKQDSFQVQTALECLLRLIQKDLTQVTKVNLEYAVCMEQKQDILGQPNAFQGYEMVLF
jgi:hypothetical protein